MTLEVVSCHTNRVLRTLLQVHRLKHWCAFAFLRLGGEIQAIRSADGRWLQNLILQFKLNAMDNLTNKDRFKCRFDFEIGYLIKSPCRECESRKVFPACISNCNILDKIHTLLSQSVSSVNSLWCAIRFRHHLSGEWQRADPGYPT